MPCRENNWSGFFFTHNQEPISSVNGRKVLRLVLLRLQVQIIPDVTMGAVLDALRLEQVSVVRVGFFKQFFQPEDVGQMIDGMHAMCKGKPYPVARTKSGMTVHGNAEWTRQQFIGHGPA